MVMRSISAKLAVPVILSGVLAGCAGPVQVKPMVADPEGYSATNFSSARVAVPPGVLASPGAERLGFKRLTVYGESIVAGAEKKPDAVKVTYETTYINDGNNGAVRIIEQTFSNGLPSGMSFELNYHGVANMAIQVAALRNQTAHPIISLRSVKAWDSLADVRENSVYSFEGSSSIRDPLAQSFLRNRHCESQTFYDANRFIQGTPGRAIDLLCTDFNSNGVKQTELKFVWLTAYNLAISTRVTSARGTLENQVERIRVD